MKYFDRIYGELKFPPIIHELLTCPGLLRLRDVRMANNQFAAFPAFANTSRYEHSLGVCYLAGLCAKTLGLPEKDTTELMIACLYHDVGTPPFAHAMEEVLQVHFNFDHEDNLRQIINGTNGAYEGNLEQVYLGGTTKLRSICQSKQGRKAGLNLSSLYRIADIIVGKKGEVLSPLLNGNGMDLDNIDNVIRASSAMGIIDAKETGLAVELAQSFVFDDKNEICYNAMNLNEIYRWQEIRDEQYSAIFESIDDFAYQTMIKSALSLMLMDENADERLNIGSWKLTDSSILYNHLLKNPKSKQIINRVQLCRPFFCLGVLYVKGNDVNKFINSNLTKIEEIASEYFKMVMKIRDEDDRIKNLSTNVVVANFYPDKRKRRINDALLMGLRIPIDNQNTVQTNGALLGLFTPLYNSNRMTVDITTGESMRKNVSFKKNDIYDLIGELKRSVFQDYDISVYRRKIND